MTNLTAVAGLDDVPQLETGTIALGGPGGPMNTQAQALLNRTAYIINQLALKASLASPAFTGTPTAPTPSPSDDSTKLATTAYVKTNLSGLATLLSPVFTGLPTAPTAIADDASLQIANTSFVDTYFAKKNSPAFTGTPTAVTPPTNDSSTRLATTDYVKANLNSAGFAPLGSPNFTGTPTAPTQNALDDSTRIATTAFVKAVVTGLGVGDFAPLTSPEFTGTPTAPTAPSATNTTQLATTAFARSLIGLRNQWRATINGATALSVADVGKSLDLTNTGVGVTYNVTLPVASTVENGGCIHFARAVFNALSDSITITSVVDGATNQIVGLGTNGDIQLKYGQTVTVCSDGVNWIIVSGSYLDALQAKDTSGSSGYQVFANGYIHQWGRTTVVATKNGSTITLPYTTLSTIVAMAATCERDNTGDDGGVTATIERATAGTSLTQIILTARGGDGNYRSDAYVNWNVWGYR